MCLASIRMAVLLSEPGIRMAVLLGEPGIRMAVLSEPGIRTAILLFHVGKKQEYAGKSPGWWTGNMKPLTGCHGNKDIKVYPLKKKVGIHNKRELQYAVNVSISPVHVPEVYHLYMFVALQKVTYAKCHPALETGQSLLWIENCHYRSRSLCVSKYT